MTYYIYQRKSKISGGIKYFSFFYSMSNVLTQDLKAKYKSLNYTLESITEPLNHKYIFVLTVKDSIETDPLLPDTLENACYLY